MGRCSTTGREPRGTRGWRPRLPVPGAIPNSRRYSCLLCTLPNSSPERDPLPKCGMRSGHWGDSEGFLEAVTLSRALKRRSLHSLNEYRHLLCTRSSGPCGLVLPTCTKIARASLPKGAPTQQRDANHIAVQGLYKDPCGLRLLTPVSTRAGARVPSSRQGPLLHTRCPEGDSSARSPRWSAGGRGLHLPACPPRPRSEARLSESEPHSKYLY